MPTGVTGAVFAASTIRSVGAVIVVLAMAALVVYFLVNLRSSRAEVGSEIELAPNRKPYYDDEQLESTKLTRTLGSGMALLGVVALGLPLYWLAEPGRQDGAVDEFTRIFEGRGEEQYVEGSQCVNCHGTDGVGGQAPFTVLDANGEFVAMVNWLAPALDTVLLRFTREEVHEIIDLGRPGTPMPAWGVNGGGPRSEQQIDDLIHYLASIQLPYEEAQRDGQVQLAIELGLLTDEQRDDDAAVDAALEQIDYSDLATGEAIFNLGKDPVYAGGAYACARCHTRGWSILTEGEDAIQGATIEDLEPYVDYEDGSGSYGWTLDNLVPRKFASVDELAEFVSLGSEDGAGFGNSGLGTGRMPGYGDDPNTETVAGDGMMTPEMICSVAQYAATLRGDEGSSGEVPTTTVPPSTTTSSTTTTTQPEEESEGEGDEAEGGAQQGYCELAGFYGEQE